MINKKVDLLFHGERIIRDIQLLLEELKEI